MADPDELAAPRSAPQGPDQTWLDYEGWEISARRRRLDAVGLALVTPIAAVGAGVRSGARGHWLLLFNLGNLILLLGAFVSPVVQALGWPAGSLTFAVYQVVCLQRPTHSFFLWGYQVSMEDRMLAISAAQAAGGLLYAWVRRRRALRPLNAWLFLAWSAPLLFDVFSQTLGWRESDAVWRVSTGTLFGLGSIWLFFPLFAWAWAPRNRTGKVKLRLDGSWHA